MSSNFTSGLATLYVYNTDGTLFGNASVVSGATGSTFQKVTIGNNEGGFEPGTTYFQNLMLNWTNASSGPLFGTQTSSTPAVPVITSAGSANGTVGTAFSYQITGTNSPTSFNATGLPGGLSVSTSTGLILGYAHGFRKFDRDDQCHERWWHGVNKLVSQHRNSSRHSALDPYGSNGDGDHSFHRFHLLDCIDCRGPMLSLVTISIAIAPRLRLMPTLPTPTLASAQVRPTATPFRPTNTQGNTSGQSSSANATTQSSGGGGQLWSGILATSRAINWTGAGVTGGIPTNQTQCVTTACQTVTTNGPASTAAQIQAAWASAPANSYVFLPAGTYSSVTSLTLSGVSNVTLRGAGANRTIIPGPINVQSSDGNNATSPNNGPVLVSGSVAQGATTVTLATVPHLKVGNPIVLDQTDTTNDNGGPVVLGSNSTYTGAFTAPGSAGPYSTIGETQNARCPGGQNVPSNCYHQEQFVTVTSCNGVTTAGAACSGTNVTVGISSPLQMPNWSTANGMEAWWGTSPVQYSGVEDLTSNDTNVSGSNGIQLTNCSNCWVKGVAIIDTNLAHFQANWGTNDSVVDSYFFLTQNTLTSFPMVLCVTVLPICSFRTIYFRR